MEPNIVIPPEILLKNNKDKSLVNLSNYILSPHAARVLKRGLKFVPTPKKCNIKDLLEPLEEFKRRIRLQKYFSTIKSGSGRDRRFRHKSTWNPPTDQELEKILDTLSDNIKKLTSRTAPPNLSRRELKAIRDLKKLGNKIVIKPADKGSAVVIMNRQDYIAEGERQLSNQLHYRQLECSIAPENSLLISQIFDKLQDKGLIDAGQACYLKGDIKPSPRGMYMLPKIHKPIDKWPEGSPLPPGRPIVSDCSSESHNSAEYVDYFLAPLATSHKSYLKDTTDFLTKLQSYPVPKNAFLATIDVDALYTNINNPDGIEAVRQAFIRSPDPFRPDKEVLELLRINLEGNDFEFDGKWYLQIYGTSMGKLFAPHYADIFMAHWEQEALAKCPIQPLVYLRFLDDIFIIWLGTKAEFYEFLEILNQHHHSIKLKAEFNEASVDFLDTTIYKGTRFQNCNMLDTKVYVKPTDSSELLHMDSNHPKHTFPGIVYSQILRIFRISSGIEDRDNTCQNFFKALKNRKYTKRMLRDIKNKVLHRNAPAPQGRSHTCNSPACKMCKTPNFIQNTGVVHDSRGRPHTIPTTQTCSTTNGVYHIHCDRCKKAYVGETGGEFRTRIHHHRSDVRRNNDDNRSRRSIIGSHFNSGLCNKDDMRITFLEHFNRIERGDLKYDPNKLRRLQLERKWQIRLVTCTPFGLNKVTSPMDESLLPLVVPYSETAQKMSKLCRSAYAELRCLTPQLFYKEMVSAYQKNPNLKDTLTRCRLSKIEQGKDGSPQPGTRIFHTQDRMERRGLSETLTLPFTLTSEVLEEDDEEDAIGSIK